MKTVEQKTDIALPLVSLYLANSKKEAIVALQGLSFLHKVETIKSVIDLINAESEMLIAQGVNDLAIIKMSQVVMLEEVEMLIERISNKVSL